MDTLAQWKKRRAKLKRILWDLLLGGKVPPPTNPKYHIDSQGKSAEKEIKAAINRHIKAFSDVVTQHPTYFNFQWHKPITWDTFIISYPSWQGEPPQRAILRVPKNLDKPAPAVLCFHGHTRGCHIGKEYLDYIAIPLTAKGFVTLAPDATRFGDRRDTTFEKEEIRDWKGYAFLSERKLATALLLEGRTLIGVMTWEHSRAIDILQSMDFVDAKKIGCVGMSMGGQQSFFLSMMDERIACGVEACGVSSYKIWTKEQTINALVAYIPHILKYTDTPEMGSLIAPRPFMCLDAANDVFFPLKGIKELGRAMRKTYKLYGASQRFKQYIHRGEHTFTKQHINYAIHWLDRWLNNENDS